MTVEYFPVMRLEPPQLETPVLPPAEPVVPEKERRREPRFPCSGTAEIEIPHAGLRIRGQILDLSHSGCFIAAPSITLERGTQVEVLFETHQISIRVRGNILSLRPHAGVGIAFLAVSPRIARQIDALVDELAAAPDSPECDDAA